VHATSIPDGGRIAKRLDRFRCGNAIEVMKGDQAIHAVADRLERLVNGAQTSDGIRPLSPKRRGGPSPWLVVGAALAGGYLAGKLIDWRSHAHRR
jgi:hypothetical protein